MGAQWLFAAARPADRRRRPGRRRWSRPSTPTAAAPDVQFNVMPLSVDKPGDPLHRFSGFTASAAQCRPRVARHASRSARPIRSRRRASSPNYLTEPLDAQDAGRRPADAARDLRAAGVSRPRHRRGVPAGQRRSDAEPRSRPSRAPRAARCSTRSAPAAWAATTRSVVDPQLRVRGVERPARRRRVGHAADGLGQHQRGGDHDRREGRGADPRGRGRRAGAAALHAQAASA